MVYDSEFESFLDFWYYDIDDLLDQVQSNPIDLHRRSDDYYWSYSDGMEALFNLDFDFWAIESEWWDDNGDSEALPTINEILDAGQAFLGSSQDWSYQGGTGTHSYNQGFDILLTFTGEGATLGGAGNYMVNYCRVSFSVGDMWKYSLIVTLHEFYHLYEILEGGGGPGQSDTPSGYVMNDGTSYQQINPPYHSYGNGWFRIDYQNNYLVFWQYEDKYDGR